MNNDSKYSFDKVNETENSGFIITAKSSFHCIATLLSSFAFHLIRVN